MWWRDYDPGMTNPEKEKSVMWEFINKNKACPKCNEPLNGNKEKMSDIADIIECEECHAKIWFGSSEFFGAFYI